MPSTWPSGHPAGLAGETTIRPVLGRGLPAAGASHVSWFQAEPQTSVDLIRAHATPHTPIIDVGADTAH